MVVTNNTPPTGNAHRFQFLGSAEVTSAGEFLGVSVLGISEALILERKVTGRHLSIIRRFGQINNHRLRRRAGWPVQHLAVKAVFTLPGEGRPFCGGEQFSSEGNSHCQDRCHDDSGRGGAVVARIT